MLLTPHLEQIPIFSKARRAWLLGSLFVLIVLLLMSLVWLVGRYEQSRFEDQLERSASSIATEIRSQLTHRAHQVQHLALPSNQTHAFLNLSPDIVRIEQRDRQLKAQFALNAPTPALGVYSKLPRSNFLPEVYQACALAVRTSEPAFSPSYFVPQGDGSGIEVMDMCLPKLVGGQLSGYTVITFSLHNILKQWVNTNSSAKLMGDGQQEVLLIAADGSRLATSGTAQRKGDKFAAQSLLDLPGVTLILRVETWIAAPFWLANTPTALVLALALALGIVLWLLFRDTRKRLRTEAEFRQSQERLQRSARLATLGEMASMLSHELNQPLAAIASYATGSLNLLNTEPHALDIYEIKIALERIATQSQRAGQVIKSINDFVRRREADRTAVAPRALFDAILPLLALHARQHDIRLIVQAAPDLPLVWCDKTLIEQVLINLARNGMQAMHNQPSDAGFKILSLTAQTQSTNPTLANNSPTLPPRTGYIDFWIEDTGPGISAQVQEKLFTPFFTTKEEGTGLGLSLCRTVIEQHGSNLTYTSNEATRVGACTGSQSASTTGARFGFQLKIHLDNSCP
jgi:signal transduction histidine kinase